MTRLDNPSPDPFDNHGHAVAYRGGVALLAAPHSDDYKGHVAVYAPRPRPDLVVDGIALTPEKPRHNDDLAFHATIANHGKGAAEAFRVRIEVDGVLLGDVAVGGVAAGKSHVAVSVPWRALLGDHKVRVTADFHDELLETDETNNVAARTFHVRCENPGPDDGGYTCRVVPLLLLDASKGTVLSLKDGETSLPIALPFVFPFYGEGQALARIAGDGFLAFGPTGTDPTCCEGQAIPAQAGPDHVVAGYWADLDPAKGGTIRHASVEAGGKKVFVADFAGVAHRVGAAAATFQIQLWEDGRILVQFADVRSNGAYHAAGIEDLTGTTGSRVATGDFSLVGLGVEIAPGAPPVPEGWKEEKVAELAFPATLAADTEVAEWVRGILPPLGLAPGATARASVSYRYDPSQASCPAAQLPACAVALPIDPTDPVWIAGKGKYAHLLARIEFAGESASATHSLVIPLAGQAVGWAPR